MGTYASVRRYLPRSETSEPKPLELESHVIDCELPTMGAEIQTQIFCGGSLSP